MLVSTSQAAIAVLARFRAVIVVVPGKLGRSLDNFLDAPIWSHNASSYLNHLFYRWFHEGNRCGLGWHSFLV